ncbi:ATP-binding protein [Actinoplanes sp. DH11]|uniref:HAMP domain-containing sensor histidine kinase n=1 Tax=Actinoplanes sp. DH11 TaxID=2857011 RepID=UPI0035B4B773
MIALLAVLGLVVGTTAEIYLHKSLYTQLDQKLDEARKMAGGGPFQFRGQDPATIPPEIVDEILAEPPASAQPGWIVVFLNVAADGSTSYRAGGLVQYLEADERSNTFRGSNYYAKLSATSLSALSAVPVGGAKTDVGIDVGGESAEYRVMVTTSRVDDSVVQVTALPLADVNHTLVTVAMFTGGVVLGSLLIAGWGGALIVRRTLKPLDRVAATATRVSELRLDRGEVRLAQRVPEPDTDPRTEVGQVGAALNRLLDHVGNALEARHASEMQVRQFVADASHELRTPLAAIRGYAELSRRSRQAVPEEIAHVLTRVESEAKRMTTLVEDLLLLARLDAGRPLAQDEVDLTMLAVDATSDAHAAGPGHYWQLDLPDEPVTVVGDGARLHQVLANLLANARTHTPEGSTVTVQVGAVPDAAVLRVSDDGPGIQPDLLPRIFERFARGDSSRSRAAGSTGLGLSIVHAVVTSHGGKVGVQSRPGQTIFTVMLPLGPSAVVPTAEQQPQALHAAG